MVLVTQTNERTSLVDGVEDYNPYHNRRAPGIVTPSLYPYWLAPVLILFAGLLQIIFLVGSSTSIANQAEFLATAMWTAAYLIAYHDFHELKGDVKMIQQRMDKNHAEAMKNDAMLYQKIEDNHAAALQHSDMNQHVVLEQVQKLDKKVDHCVEELKVHIDVKLAALKEELRAAFTAILEERGVLPPARAAPKPDDLSRQVSGGS
ncbi:hypothetical protein IV203_016260 [Nitzschia inconspicua]|uniref:Uncharacterized protein n=1 Tax=Nitzschia inconspicua TaxID=303405 RepID=A0A9K3KPP1_9STRA|nr:hypothetical protein IV203_017474 [Nitzschia inconspicua]KAG7347555.1 hypothetical protein IV203_016260 [Nitzschia inconspicua]